ncbi:hypothetical protein P7F88_01900 [Vibrio hannami]|nr:hypothetical protein [Vibrio hannami]MDG3084908.1 hypothetical protein [Vibrio hannami]
MLADILLSEGRYQQAEDSYKSLLALYSKPDDLEWIWLRIAQAQYQQNKWTSVEQSVDNQQKYQNQAGFNPKISPLNMKLYSQVALGKYTSAIYTTKAIRELEPNNLLWWKQLTSLYMHTQNYNLALVTLQQSERAGFELSKQYLELLAQLYGQLGVPEKAAETFQRLAVKYGELYFTVQAARYWQTAREWVKAESVWKQAAIHDGKYYWQLAQLKIQLHQYQGALDAIEKMPDMSSTVLLAKTRALNALGKHNKALESAKLAHQQSPSEESLSWIRYLSVLSQ